MKLFEENRWYRVILLLGFVLLFGGTTLVQALTIESATLEELTSESPLIVEGKVIDQFAEWDDAHRNIYTYNMLRIQRTIKGEYAEQTVVVRELGGRVGDVSAVVNGLQYMNQGDHVLLFLRETDEENIYKIHSFALGKFSVISNDGVTKVRHALGDDQLLQKDGSSVLETESLELDSFLRKISEVTQK